MRKRVARYGGEFKLTALRLIQEPGMLVRAVAAALDIHRFMFFMFFMFFMLSKWQKDVRDGVLRGHERRRCSRARKPYSRNRLRKQLVCENGIAVRRSRSGGASVRSQVRT
jgi:transposase-like protein